MKNFFIGHISAFFFLSILTTAYPLQATEDALPLRARYFKIQIKFPGEAALTGKHYMDIKRGVVGFGRDGETFEAYINGTEQGNSYLITRSYGYGFLLEDEVPRYDFRVDFSIPPTDFKAYWAVHKNVLTCHLLANGFKYFPDPEGGYIIRWDTRDEMGMPFLMWVEWCKE